MADGNSSAGANGAQDPLQAPNAASGGSGFSLSFGARGNRQATAAARAKPSSAQQQSQERELITGFASGQSEAADKKATVQRGQLVIPLQQDTFQGAARGPRAHNPDRSGALACKCN